MLRVYIPGINFDKVPLREMTKGVAQERNKTIQRGTNTTKPEISE